MRRPKFLWFDLETTGLDPHEGTILEWAAVLCEDTKGGDFEIFERSTGVVHHPSKGLDTLPINDYVRDMHERNGLWADVAKARDSIENADSFLACVAHTLGEGVPHSVMLAGSSVHFDLAYCRVHLPKFSALLSHRVFDVRTLRTAVDTWGTTDVDWPKRDAHRALPDVLTTIEECRLARRALAGAG